MAKKKPEGKKAKPSAAEPLAELPPSEVLEGMMRQLVGRQRDHATPETPLEQAQDLMYQAFEERNPRRRVELANEALRLSPDCADAHVVLAQHSPSRKQALAHYEQGVAAGERAIGPDAFQKNVGYFWGVLETRPYMRARLGLVQLLWTTARRDEAVQHLQDMLRLNPGDNQGVRYTLASELLFLDRDDDLARLLDQFPDEGSASWGYTKALLAFRRHGDTSESRDLLVQATKTNRHVPPYLLGTKFQPAEMPRYTSRGTEGEAIEYVGEFLVGWKSTLGAVAWLRASVTKPKVTPPPFKGPGTAVKNAINKLPQPADVWQADYRPLPNWVGTEEGLVRPWVIMVVSQTEDLVLGHQVLSQMPGLAEVWEVFAKAIRKPTAGNPHRPTKLEVLANDAWEALRPSIESVGIALEVCEELDIFDEAYDSLAEHFGQDSPPGLLDLPEMTPERVGAFYDAAAGFYRQTPWKRVGFESAIEIECEQIKSGPWYAVLMGQSGLTMGIALYEDLAKLRRMWANDADDEENAHDTVALTVMFGPAWSISTTDLDASAYYGWPVARPDAYPETLFKEQGMSMRLPSPRELELLEGCLRAVPDFVAHRKQDDTTREERTVPTASGPLKLTLSWIPEE